LPFEVKVAISASLAIALPHVRARFMRALSE